MDFGEKPKNISVIVYIKTRSVTPAVFYNFYPYNYFSLKIVFTNTAGTQGERYFRRVSGVPRMGRCVPWIRNWTSGRPFEISARPCSTKLRESLFPSRVWCVVQASLFQEPSANSESKTTSILESPQPSQHSTLAKDSLKRPCFLAQFKESPP